MGDDALQTPTRRHADTPTRFPSRLSDSLEMPKSVRIMEQIILWIEFVRLQLQPEQCARFTKAERFTGAQCPLLDQPPVVKFVEQVRGFFHAKPPLDRRIGQSKVMHSTRVIITVSREEHDDRAIPIKFVVR